MKKRYILFAFAFPALFWLVWVILMLDPFPKSVPVAVYDNVRAQIVRDQVTRISVERNADGPGIVNIYIRIAPDRILPIVCMTQKDAEQLQLDRHETTVNQRKSVFYDSGFTILEFDSKGLKGATVESGHPIYLSAKPEGPFFRLPISKDFLLQEFGQPERWGRGSTFGF